MSEIKKEIKPNADGSYTITDAHSTADIVRWLLTQDSKETILYLLNEALAQPEQELEFVTHNVDKPYDWSEWVCPNPSGYLMKCCDCGLVHEAEFGVVRYKSETEREDCDMVDDPNLQAVFRMRRSEKWLPEDTAYRPGGLAQPEQEPVAWIYEFYADMGHKGLAFEEQRSAYNTPLYTAPPQRTWVGLTDEDLIECERLADIRHRKHMGSIRGQQLSPADQFLWHYAHAIEAKLRSKNHE